MVSPPSCVLVTRLQSPGSAAVTVSSRSSLVRACVRACVPMCACVCLHVCAPVRLCVGVCARVRVCAYALVLVLKHSLSPRRSLLHVAYALTESGIASHSEVRVSRPGTLSGCPLWTPLSLPRPCHNPTRPPRASSGGLSPPVRPSPARSLPPSDPHGPRDPVGLRPASRLSYFRPVSHSS